MLTLQGLSKKYGIKGNHKSDVLQMELKRVFANFCRKKSPQTSPESNTSDSPCNSNHDANGIQSKAEVGVETQLRFGSVLQTWVRLFPCSPELEQSKSEFISKETHSSSPTSGNLFTYRNKAVEDSDSDSIVDRSCAILWSAC